MSKIKRAAGGTGLVLCGALFATLTGCTTYVEQPRPREAYLAPPPVQAEASVSVGVPGVEIRAESDFYEPLTPYGEWVVIGSYGRCWRPGRVEAGWRPYCNGNWQRTDAGWYWASDEPWGWATYHYGRWDFSAQWGWYWWPQTQWAPAWVSWHQGGGYVGWAPLQPSVRVSAGGFVGYNQSSVSPQAYVLVEQRHFLEPVRPATVVVNNTTIINKTVNITNVKVVNNTVINEGPRAQVIEQASGRTVQSVPVKELRRKSEAGVVAQQRITAVAPEKTVPAPVRSEVQPRATKAAPAPEQRQAAKPVVTARAPEVPAPKKLQAQGQQSNTVPSPAKTRAEVVRPAGIKEPAAPSVGRAAPQLQPPPQRTENQVQRLPAVRSKHEQIAGEHGQPKMNKGQNKKVTAPTPPAKPATEPSSE